MSLEHKPQRHLKKLRAPEAAKYLGSSTSTLAKMRLRGDGPPYSKVGPRIVLYDVDDLEVYLAARRRRSTSEDPCHFSRQTHIDFAAINRAALQVLPPLLSNWLPDGRLEGDEWVARNPTRRDRFPGSFKVNMCSGKWADFATGDAGGDVVSLAAYLAGTGQAEAARKLAEMLGVRHD